MLDALMRMIARNEHRVAARLGAAWSGPYGAMARWYGRRRRTVRLETGARIEVNPQDFVGGRIWAFGAWEPNLTTWLKRTLKPGDHFIDVGANVGYYTLLASHLVGEAGQVWSVEASPTTYRDLDQNIRRNGLRNVRSFNVAAADRRGALPFFLGPPENRGESNLFGRLGFTEEAMVEAWPLDELLAGEDLGRMRVIKVDVEGAEDLVVAGMPQTLARLPPTTAILMEVLPEELARRGGSIEGLIAAFGAHGFQPYVIDNDYSPWGYHRPSYLPPEPMTQTPVDCADMIFSRQPL